MKELTKSELKSVQGGDIDIKDGDKTLISVPFGVDVTIDIKPLLDLFR